jgi:hypothetical protein
MDRALKRNVAFMAVIAAGLAGAACSPTVKVQAPKEPITINLNIKLDADVRVRLEQEAKQDVASKPIF